MEPIRQDVVGGFNAFLTEQQAVPDAATFTLVQFDSQDPYEVLHDHVDLAGVPPLRLEQYVPRASTPLYDAIGRGILELEAALALLPDGVGPERVIFVIVTDGAENASNEFTRDRVTALINAKKELGWDFVFLSADLEAFEDAGRMGVDMSASLMFSKSKRGNDAAWDLTSKKIRERRANVAEGIAFSEDERKSAAE
jgi:hypothetical protein